MNGYDLSRNWFDWCFENPEKITPTHTAMYFFIIEHCNRLGWKEKFGLPMEMTKDAIGIKNYKTYSKTFNDLVEWGFIKVIQKSINQYSSSIIAIVENTKALTEAPAKALDKAMQKHSQKQCKSIVGIDKQENKEPITKKPITISVAEATLKPCTEIYNNFILSQTNCSAKIDGAQINALKQIIKYLEKNILEQPATVEGIKNGFNAIFEKFDYWSDFHKKNLKLTQINSDLVNIIHDIKNFKKLQPQTKQQKGQDAAERVMAKYREQDKLKIQ